MAYYTRAGSMLAKMGSCVVDCYAFPYDVPKHDYTSLLGNRLHKIDYVGANKKYCTIFAAVYDAPHAPYLTFIYVHANAENLYLTNYYMEYASQFFNSRFITFDWEGYGMSTGKHSSEAQLLEGCDMVYYYAVCDLKIDPTTIGFWGRSIGTVGASYLAQKHSNAHAVILQCPLASALSTIFKRVICSACDSLESNERVKTIAIPIVLIHGCKDQIVDFHNSEILFDSYVSAHSGGDGDCLNDGNDYYEGGGSAMNKQDNFFPGMGKRWFRNIEFYEIRNGGHNDLDSVFKRQMYYIVKKVIERRVGDVWG